VAKVNLNISEDAHSIKKRIRMKCLGEIANYKIPTKVIISNEHLHNIRQKKLRK
jgi:hypothetical protein